VATGGYDPHGYQARIAREGLPDVVAAPTGTGKTGVILAWLWRRLHGDPAGTPRRLVYALPQRSLVEQVARETGRWLANLGLADEVALYVVMGGKGESQRQWRLDMHKPAIVVGTVDSLVSKALNRGYGIGRAAFPVDFALVTNAHLSSPVVFGDLDVRFRPYDPRQAYAESKTAAVLLAVEATRRWAGDGIYANAANPGAIATGLQKYTGGLQTPAERRKSVSRERPPQYSWPPPR